MTTAAMQSATTPSASTTGSQAPACTMTQVTVAQDTYSKCGSNWGNDAPAPRVGDLVLHGTFVALDEGSAVERVVIGFGRGASTAPRNAAPTASRRSCSPASRQQGWIAPSGED